ATVSKDAQITDAITDQKALEGLVVRYPMSKGDQFSPVKVGQYEKATGSVGPIVPPGKRAVSVDVEEKTNVGGLIVAGDHVDVIVIGKAKPTDGGASNDQ